MELSPTCHADNLKKVYLRGVAIIPMSGDKELDPYNKNFAARENARTRDLMSA